MNYIETFKKYMHDRKEKKFWNNPDCLLAAIILDPKGSQVFGKVRNDLAILERIPSPSTGYHYLDIVKVEGPTGKQYFRDEKIDEYIATSLYKKSNIPTFMFVAILPKSRDYFSMLNFFKSRGQKAEFQWSDKEDNNEWRDGYCTSRDFTEAESILSAFIKEGQNRQFKNLKKAAD